MNQIPFFTPPSTPPYQVRPADSFYDGAHANFRHFIYCILRQAIKMPNFLTVEERQIILQIAIDDEENNLRGEAQSAALTGYRNMLENMENVEVALVANGFEDEPSYQELLEISFHDWIEDCIPNLPIYNPIYNHLHNLRETLMHGHLNMQITGPTPISP